MNSEYKDHWLTAMHSELESHHANNSWRLVKREPGMKVIPSKWVLSIKTDENDKFERFKARLVAGGHRQTFGVDYDETYAPVSRTATQRVLLAVAAHNDWLVVQVDYNTAFLNGKLEGKYKVHMEQPPGFKDGNDFVCEVLASVYGCKQSPWIWYLTMKAGLEKLGFEAVSFDPSFFVMKNTTCHAYIVAVVDDLLITSPNPSFTNKLVEAVLSLFPGKSGGQAHHYNGVKITWMPAERAVLLSQQKHVDKLVKQFSHLNSDWKPSPTPLPAGLRMTAEGTKQISSPLLDVTKYPYRAIVGSMSYIAHSTRPDIAYAVNQLAKFLNAPTVLHWDAALHVLRYLNGTREMGIKLGTSDVPVEAFVDSSHGTGTPNGKPHAGW